MSKISRRLLGLFIIVGLTLYTVIAMSILGDWKESTQSFLKFNIWFLGISDFILIIATIALK